MATKSSLRDRVWKRDTHFISTDPSLIPIPTLQEAYASPVFYWADALPDAVLEETLQSSLCFGLYEGQPDDTVEGRGTPPLVGFSRGITDYSTFIYLTDVWVHPSQQGKGLGRWMMQCCQELIVEMPYLRRSLLFTADWERSVPFYQEILDMKVLEGKRGEGLALMERWGKGHPFYGKGS